MAATGLLKLRDQWVRAAPGAIESCGNHEERLQRFHADAELELRRRWLEQLFEASSKDSMAAGALDTDHV
ncbi:hypothetical protein MKX07_005874 [Trichoderma sp. CBMAI-0711]|nr:hypothetical protein MKX07_005874 [Trichoderma sp. CBMAI-0711]